jgi:hypothetical protein
LRRESYSRKQMNVDRWEPRNTTDSSAYDDAATSVKVAVASGGEWQHCSSLVARCLSWHTGWLAPA